MRCTEETYVTGERRKTSQNKKDLGIYICASSIYVNQTHI
jgi:hypothetical protein